MLTVLRPANVLVKQFFEESSDYHINLRDSGFCGPLVDLASREHSPVMSTLADYYEILSGAKQVWSPLFKITTWDSNLRCSLQLVILRMLVGIWFRLVEHYQHYPWPLTTLVHPKVSEDDRFNFACKFMERSQCCIGQAAGSPLQRTCQSATDLLRPKRRRFLQALFRNCKAQTIPVESRFARIRTHSSASHGNMQSVTTVCSNHVNKEAQSLHEALKKMKFPNRAKKKKSTTAKHPVSVSIKRAVTAWNVYVTEQRKRDARQPAETPKEQWRRVSRSCSKRWREMNATAKRKYKRAALQKDSRKKAKTQASDSRDAQKLKPSETVWGLGDDSYFLSSEKIKAEMQRHIDNQTNFVKAEQEAWQTMVGHFVEDSSLRTYPEDDTKECQCGPCPIEQCNSLDRCKLFKLSK